ncbi:MAG: DUF5615 family PIN-like protein [Planctomycetes bacterium]|nr:DUF5615 family PIN-like protein [Planctomycetota bacterium]
MPHFLIDASLPRDTRHVIEAAGYQATDVRDVGLRTAADPDIADYARRSGLCLITRDLDFADVREYPPADYAGMVVVRTPDDAGRTMVLGMIEAFLGDPELIQRLPGRLAIVEPARVRLRPA